MAKSKFNFKNSSLRWLFSSTFVEDPKIIYGYDFVALLNILHANVRIDTNPFSLVVHVRILKATPPLFKH